MDLWVTLGGMACIVSAIIALRARRQPVLGSLMQPAE
jgi:hypothetical protein